MNVIIIPGLIGHPNEKTFDDLEKLLIGFGHKIIKIAWPFLPQDLNKYSFSETILYTRKIIQELNSKDIAILGFSMGGIIASQLASEFQIKKLGLIVSPYQAGTHEDLNGKYKDWKEKGYRDLISSIYGELRIPFSFVKDAQNYNALDSIQKANCPTLFIVGEKDEKVSIEVSRKLFEKANEPKEWHLIAGMEHKYQYQNSLNFLEKVNQIIVDFINKD